MSRETFAGTVEPDELKISDKDKILLGKYNDYSGMKPDEDLMACFQRNRYRDMTSTEEDYITLESARTDFLLSAKFVLTLETTKWGTARQIRDLSSGKRLTIEINKNFEINRITQWVALKVREVYNGISSANIVTWQLPDASIAGEQVGFGKANSIENFYNLSRIGPSIQLDTKPQASNDYLQSVLNNQAIAREARSSLRGKLRI